MCFIVAFIKLNLSRRQKNEVLYFRIKYIIKEELCIKIILRRLIKQTWIIQYKITLFGAILGQ